MRSSSFFLQKENFMDHALVPLITLGIILALAVFIYGLIIPPILGKPSYTLPIVDAVVLAIFFAVLLFLLRATGIWERLLTGL
jgi:hypothetical protein